MKWIKITSLFLGVMSLSVGTLKFVAPFNEWYSVQIESSGLPASAFSLGIIAEIAAGIFFLVPYFVPLSDFKKNVMLTLANTSLIIVLTTATIIHLMPEVPATVLPLKIKPPVIPLSFLSLAVLNQFNIVRVATGLNRSTSI